MGAPYVYDISRLRVNNKLDVFDWEKVCTLYKCRGSLHSYVVMMHSADSS
jgi:hypothetical protein